MWESNIMNVIYLCQSYSENPEFAFMEACLIVKELRKVSSLPVFSPVLHSHHYHQVFNDTPYQQYIEWDLDIMDSFKYPPILILAPSCENTRKRDGQYSLGVRLEIEYANKQGYQVRKYSSFMGRYPK
jgi:hypothetical protein